MASHRQQEQREALSDSQQVSAARSYAAVTRAAQGRPAAVVPAYEHGSGRTPASRGIPNRGRGGLHQGQGRAGTFHRGTPREEPAPQMPHNGTETFPRGPGGHQTTRRAVPPKPLPRQWVSMKHMTCAFWARYGCTNSDKDCKYAHAWMETVAERPTPPQRGYPAMAGKNLSYFHQRLRQRPVAQTQTRDAAPDQQTHGHGSVLRQQPQHSQHSQHASPSVGPFARSNVLSLPSRPRSQLSAAAAPFVPGGVTRPATPTSPANDSFSGFLARQNAIRAARPTTPARAPGPDGADEILPRLRGSPLGPSEVRNQLPPIGHERPKKKGLDSMQ